MKTVVIGDVHGRHVWKWITNYEKPDRVIFIGDYFDSFDVPYDIQINNFLDIVKYKEESGVDVVMLLGNHDFHYLPYINDTATSGYQKKYAHLIKQIVGNYQDYLQVAYQFDDLLFTHAGASVEFMDANFERWEEENTSGHLNELFKYKPNKFLFTGNDPYGDDTFQTPIWIRPMSLMRANKTSFLKNRWVQVFGHTPLKKIDIKGHATGGRYYCIDTLHSSGEYMIIDEDSKISFNTYKNYVK